MNGFNNDTLQTISAAAMEITATENRVPRVSAQKKRWGSFWRLCFGSNKHNQRIGHAILSPETDPSSTEMPPQQHSAVFPFIAPPSSPASFLQSEPPSCTQSPSVSLSLKSASASMYYPAPPSMFTVGPYAHEPQLVSPPVLSTFTTEPSTAPFTPLQLTTPSSPDVPFACLSYHNGEYDYQSCQLYQGSGTLTPDSVAPRGNSFNKCRNSETLHDPRVSFEITAEDVVRCMAKEPSLAKAIYSEIIDDDLLQNHRKHLSTTLNSIMEFNFGNTDVGSSVEASVGPPDLWANEVALRTEGGSSKEWSFFPMIQSGWNNVFLNLRFLISAFCRFNPRFRRFIWGACCVYQTLHDPAMQELYTLGCPYI